MTRREAHPASRSLRQWPLLVVVVGVLLGLVIAMAGDNTWRLGGLVVGSALGVGALIRIALPNRDAGLLQVRSRPFDVAVLTVCGLSIIVLTLVVPGGR